MDEWDRVKGRHGSAGICFRVPIILEECSWLDLLNGDDIKVLPKDGVPVRKFGSRSAAWQQVYEGIKLVIEEIQKTFTPLLEFVEKLELTEFASTERIRLRDIFVFPRLSHVSDHTQTGSFIEEVIVNEAELLEKQRILIHGEEMSGKTALAKYLFLQLSQTRSATLYVDAKEISGRAFSSNIREAFDRQFSGDFEIWRRPGRKTLLLDNLASDARAMGFLDSAKEFFTQIVILVSTDIFNSFFRDDDRLSDFDVYEIEIMSHVQQEQLIRKRFELFQPDVLLRDGKVDQIEDRVNSIVISNKVVP